MTMRFTDGFYLADSFANLALKYDSYLNNGATPVRLSLGTNSYGFQIDTNSASGVYKSFKSVWSSSTTPIIVGFRYRLNAPVTSSAMPFFAVRSSDTTDANGIWPTSLTSALNRVVELRYNTVTGTGPYSSKLEVHTYNASGSSTTSFTSTAVLSSSTFCYIELMVYPSASAGSSRVVLSINGTQVYDSGTTVDVGTGPINEVFPCGIGVTSLLGTGGGQYADLYVCDNTGATNNAFLGDTKIETLLPNADGTTQQFQLKPYNMFPSVNAASHDTDVSPWSGDQNTPTRVTSALSGGSLTPTQGSGMMAWVCNNTYASQRVMLTASGTSGLSVVPSTAYTLVFDNACTVNGPGGSLLPMFRWYDASGTFISETTGTAATTVGQSWLRTAGVSTSPSNAAFCTVGVRVDSFATSSATLYFDGWMLVQRDVTGLTGGTTYNPPETTHFSAVDDSSSDLDSSYVRSGTSGQIEAFKYPALASASGLVAALNFAPVVRREAVGPGSVLPYMRSRGTATYIDHTDGSTQAGGSASAGPLASATQASDVFVFFMTAFGYNSMSASGGGATWVTGPLDVNNAGFPNVGAMIGYAPTAALTPTLTWSFGTASRAMAAALRFRNCVYASNPVVATAAAHGASGSSITITPTRPNQLIVVIASVDADSATFSGWAGTVTPTLITPLITGWFGPGQTAQAAYVVANAATPHTFSVSNSSGNQGLLAVALDVLPANFSGASQIAFAQDTSYHAGLDIVETSPAATSRALTIAEINDAELGFIVP